MLIYKSMDTFRFSYGSLYHRLLPGRGQADRTANVIQEGAAEAAEAVEDILRFNTC